MTRVVIVGAGASGLAAASKLASGDPGIEVIVLEASDRVGGRIRSDELGPFVVDSGAQWIHGEGDNPVLTLAKELDIIDDPKDTARLEDLGEEFVDESGTVWSDERVDGLWALLEPVQENDAERGSQMGAKSVGEYYERALEEELSKQGKENDQQLNRDLQTFKDYFHRYYQNLDGVDDWFDLSFRGSVLLYDELPGNDMITFKRERNFMDVLDSFIGKLPKNCIRLNSNVSKIRWSENGVKLTVNGDENIQADFCVFTGSLGYLKAHEKELFEPRLPEDKLRLIRGLEFGVVDKIHLTYDTEWWPDDVEGFVFLHNSDSHNFDYCDAKQAENDWTRWILGLYRVMHKEGLMCAWVTAAGAEQMEKESDSEVITKMTAFFKRFLGKEYPDITAPTRIVRSRWRCDPHALGSYTYLGLTADELAVAPGDFAKSDSTKRLRFAGEATHERFFSTVHGAVDSGWREAEKILNEIKKD